MYTKISSFLKTYSYVLSLGALCVMMSFTIGVQTAGDVQPVRLIEAGSSQHPGDIDGDGTIGVQDAILVLEITQGYREATPEQLLADPNKDGELTVDDAIRILSLLALR